MQSLGRSLLLLDRTFTPEETVQKIERVTMEDVMASARAALNVEPCLSAAGKGAAAFGK